MVADGLLRGVDDGSMWSLEFEMGSPDHCRLIEHHAAVVRAYPGAQVETVVFWGRSRWPCVATSHLSRGGHVLCARRRDHESTRECAPLSDGSISLRVIVGLQRAPSRTVPRERRDGFSIGTRLGVQVARLATNYRRFLQVISVSVIAPLAWLHFRIGFPATTVFRGVLEFAHVRFSWIRPRARGGPDPSARVLDLAQC